MANVQFHITLMIMFFLAACEAGPKHENHELRDSIKTRKPEILKKPSSSYQDSLFINSPAAIFFVPDSLQMEKIRRVNEKGIYESLTHDCYYQMRNAQLVIERNWPEIRIIRDSNARWLIFKKPTGTITVDLDEVNNICGIYLFDGVKDPIRIDMTNIDSELGFYFKK
jgi:hypothetical protein